MITTLDIWKLNFSIFLTWNIQSHFIILYNKKATTTNEVCMLVGCECTTSLYKKGVVAMSDDLNHPDINHNWINLTPNKRILYYYHATYSTPRQVLNITHILITYQTLICKYIEDLHINHSGPVYIVSTIHFKNEKTICTSQ